MWNYLFSNFRWYRKLRGGDWYLNRYWFDLGRGCISVWERIKGQSLGGPDCYFLGEEEHYKNKDFFYYILIFLFLLIIILINCV